MFNKSGWKNERQRETQAHHQQINRNYCHVITSCVWLFFCVHRNLGLYLEKIKNLQVKLSDLEITIYLVLPQGNDY